MIEPADLDVHLATCAECAGELARYREVIASVASLRGSLEWPSPGFPERVVAHVVGPGDWRVGVRRLAHDRRAHVAAASLGGALVGAGAIAILWWRLARRAVAAGDGRAVTV